MTEVAELTREVADLRSRVTNLEAESWQNALINTLDRKLEKLATKDDLKAMEDRLTALIKKG
jgi:hypothetical protein